MKVLVCGSRNIDSFSLVQKAIVESGFEVTEIISGGAKGVDALAEQYARTYEIPTQIFKPDWKKFGKKAGILRNAEMVKIADAVIAIWDGQSKGTKSSIDFTKKAAKPLFIYQYS